MMNSKLQPRPLLLALVIGAATLPVSAQNAAISPTRIEQIAATLSAKSAGFGSPCSDRAAWEPLAGKFRQQIEQAEILMTKSFPAWDDNAYLEFSRTGSRILGEKMMNARQDWLAPLVLAECAEGSGRFIPTIALVLDQLSTQKSWTWPAHDVKLESYSGRHYFVELNSASLAHAIAETLYLLGDQLPPATRIRAINALERRIFDPMRQTFATGKGNGWLESASAGNWNAVCLDGVTGAALSVLPGRRERALFVAAAERYSGNYLNSFTDDGYAEEGISYWNYGFSHFAHLREEIWEATGGKIDLFRNPKARRAALFGIQFQMLPNNVADFGDAEFMEKPDPVLIRYIARTFDLHLPAYMLSPNLASYHGSLPGVILANFPTHSEWKQPEQGADAIRPLLGLRTYYADPGVLVSRPAPGGQLAITIKADGNAGHSHNDIGSFVIGLGSTQPVGDPGGEVYYTAQTFTKDRYRSRLLNSFGHPVPVVGGKLQVQANTVHVKVLNTKFTEKQDSITIDMTNAYDAPELRHLERTMQYSRVGAGSVEIKDRFVLSGPTQIEESLPTHSIWKQVDSKTLEFSTDIMEPRRTPKGNSGRANRQTAVSPARYLRVTIDAPGGFHVIQNNIDDYGNPFTRVGLRIYLAKSGTITMRFVPTGAW